MTENKINSKKKLKAVILIAFLFINILVINVTLGAKTITKTIKVGKGKTYDGKGEKITARGMGDGGQGESQKPIFRLESGATLKNVRIGHPGCDGVHCHGNATVENVIWEDVGEDALTIKKKGSVTVRNCKAYKAKDKVFQVNAASTLRLINVTCKNFGKVIRQNGGTKFKCTWYIENCDFSNGSDCVARTDSKSTRLYVKNTKISGCKRVWRFPNSSQVSGGRGRSMAISSDDDTPNIIGDMNGDMKTDIIDALMIAKIYVGQLASSNAADVNCDNITDIVDALIVAKFYVGKIDSLSACNGNNSEISDDPAEIAVSDDADGLFVTSYTAKKNDKLWKKYIKDLNYKVETGGTGGNRNISQTILVKQGTTYDGKGEKLTAKGLGDGSQDEGQKPYFLLEPGATLKNVTIGKPGCEGVHMMGNNVLENVKWVDVGEDAASVRSYFPGGNITINGGYANSASDKCFQFNAPCTVRISNFKSNKSGKFIRQNGGTKFKLTIYLDNVTVNSAKEGIVRSDSSKCTVYYKNIKSNMPKSNWFRKLKGSAKSY